MSKTSPDAEAMNRLVAMRAKNLREARLKILETEPWFQDFAASLNELVGFEVPFYPLRT